MTATNTAFIVFESFVKHLGDGDVDLSGPATRFFAQLHHSGANLSAGANPAILSSVVGSVNGAVGSIRRYLANNHFTALSGAETTGWGVQSDALVWTASATMTVRYAVFFMSVAADSAWPIGYLGLVAADQEITAGNTVTLTPSPSWFRMSR